MMSETNDKKGAIKADTDLVEELLKSREEFLEIIGLYLRILAITRNTDKFEEFMAYMNRYTASEVMFLIEDHNLRDDVSIIIEKITEVKKKDEV